MERAGLNISALDCTSAVSRKLILSLSLFSQASSKSRLCQLRASTATGGAFGCGCNCAAAFPLCCAVAAELQQQQLTGATLSPSFLPFDPRQRSSLSNGDGEARFLQKLLGKTTFVRLNNPFGPLHIFTTELLYFYCDTCHVQS